MCLIKQKTSNHVQIEMQKSCKQSFSLYEDSNQIVQLFFSLNPEIFKALKPTIRFEPNKKLLKLKSDKFTKIILIIKKCSINRLKCLCNKLKLRKLKSFILCFFMC